MSSIPERHQIEKIQQSWVKMNRISITFCMLKQQKRGQKNCWKLKNKWRNWLLYLQNCWAENHSADDVETSSWLLLLQPTVQNTADFSSTFSTIDLLFISIKNILIIFSVAFTVKYTNHCIFLSWMWCET